MAGIIEIEEEPPIAKKDSTNNNNNNNRITKESILDYVIDDINNLEKGLKSHIQMQ